MFGLAGTLALPGPEAVGAWPLLAINEELDPGRVSVRKIISMKKAIYLPVQRVVAFAALFGCLAGSPVSPAFGDLISAGRIVELKGDSGGRRFEGIGALSAGASSRLLMEYPEPQRREVLDLLFKPNWGAALHHLRVEVGGDVNSTDGTEPSHMRTREDEDYTRGYEWWLMKEARRRNPKDQARLPAVGRAGWIGGGKFYSQDMADYTVKFLQGRNASTASTSSTAAFGTRHQYDVEWIKLLRRTLDAADLRQVEIVAADQVNDWKFVEEIERIRR